MFAKLKQKIAEEESSAESARPRPSSPSVRRQKINGFSENKWEKRRLSNASSLYGSRESVTSSISSYSSGFNVSRRNSFRTGAATPADSSSRSINNRSSRDEILAALASREDQITKLESKISDMAHLVREQAKTKERLEDALERQQAEHARLSDCITDKCEARIAQLKSDYEKTLEEKNEFIQFQTEATRKAAEILEKNKQLEELDKAYADQKGELSLLQERLDDLTRERTKYEMRDRQYQQRVESLEKERNSLREELHNTVSELAQKSLQLGRVEKNLKNTEDELSTVHHSYSLYKNKATADLEEKEGQISRLKERKSDLEQRLEASKFSGNDHVRALEKERELLENRLKESRDLLADVKANSSDRISTLSSLVTTLNQKLERKENDLNEYQRISAEEKSNLQAKVKSLEERLNSTNQMISDTKSSGAGKVQALRDQNDHLEKELQKLQQQLNDQRAYSEHQISTFENQIQRLESIREREKSDLQEKLDRLKAFENEYSGQEYELKQQLADLEEEKEQLQNELMVKAEEYQHMALCLEDAMKETNELKSQTENASFSRINSDLRLELRAELENTKVRCEKAELALQDREETIAELRQVLREKDTELNRSSTKLKQYEENNRLVQNDRIQPSGGKDTYRIFTGLRQQVKDLEQQLKEREMLELDENELRELRKINVQLETDVEDKDKKIKLLQLKLAELKKAFQRELKIPVPENDVHNAHTPTSCSSDGSANFDQQKDRLEYLDVNFKYLKHVILKYMCCSNKQSRQLIRVIAHMLQFTPKEHAAVEEAVEWKGLKLQCPKKNPGSQMVPDGVHQNASARLSMRVAKEVGFGSNPATIFLVECFKLQVLSSRLTISVTESIYCFYLSE